MSDISFPMVYFATNPRISPHLRAVNPLLGVGFGVLRLLLYFCHETKTIDYEKISFYFGLRPLHGGTIIRSGLERQWR